MSKIVRGRARFEGNCSLASCPKSRCHSLSRALAVVGLALGQGLGVRGGDKIMIRSTQITVKF